MLSAARLKRGSERETERRDIERWTKIEGDRTERRGSERERGPETEIGIERDGEGGREGGRKGGRECEGDRRRAIGETYREIEIDSDRERGKVSEAEERAIERD